MHNFHKTKKYILPLLLMVLLSSCFQKQIKAENPNEPILTAADQTKLYIPLLQGKNVGLVINQTSRIGNKHLVDSLLNCNISIKAIFAPEHGFRGDADAGEKIVDNIDPKTGISIISIYGKNKKPSKEQLNGIDIIIFDIQDVGVRFYTYISTMHYVMEACAENNIPLIILDRPNPNGKFVEGAVLNLKFRSFVGMHPIPILHGLTVGELAIMINEEGWLENGIKCHLTVVPCKNWSHEKAWHLQVPPSPNLPNDQSIRLYASLCLFEATKISIGRGTEFPFQVVGYPDSSLGAFSFVPQKMYGAKIATLQEGNRCYGFDLREEIISGFSLKYLIYFRDHFPKNELFITNTDFFNKLAGNDILLQQLQAGKTEKEIQQTWIQELETYKLLRKKYLLYP